MSKGDYYEILGVAKDADQETIKKAYRKLAMSYHPDRNQGDKGAEKKFKELNDAYDVLKDGDKRAAYDRVGHSAFQQGGGRSAQGFTGDFTGDFADFADVFSNIFGGGSGGAGQRQKRSAAIRGADLRYDLGISLSDAYYGKKHELKYKSAVQCDSCDGSGSASGAKSVGCTFCGGRGSVRSQQGFFTVETTCRTCSGTGAVIKDPCQRCYGQGRLQKERTIAVSIPTGVDEGTKIRVSGEGEAGIKGGKSGDLYIFISIKHHPIFQRKGQDLYCDLPIRFTTAALGGKIEVPCINDSAALLSVPSGTQSGAMFKLSGKGMPIRGGKAFGDLYVKACIETPVDLSDKQKALLEQFEQECSKHSSPKAEGFFEKVKSFLHG